MKNFLKIKSGPTLIHIQNKEISTTPSEPTKEKTNSTIKWIKPEIPFVSHNLSREIKKVGFTQTLDCKHKLTINNNVNYALLNDVVVFPDDIIMNNDIIYRHQTACGSKTQHILEKTKEMYANNKIDSRRLKKAVFISHNEFSTPQERITKELPLLSLLPQKIRNKEYVLIIPDEYSEYEKQILTAYGIESFFVLGSNGVFCEELYILDGPGCNEYSQKAISQFKETFLRMTGYTGIEPKSVVMTYNEEKEENELNSIKTIQDGLDSHFKDVSFHIHHHNKDLINEIKFWNNAKVVLSSMEGTEGNEIFLQQNSILIILHSNECFCETAQIANEQGNEVIALFHNTATFGGAWLNDILPTVEETLINNKLTMKSKTLKDHDPDDIF